MQIRQAFESWKSEIRPLVVKQYGEDECALAESWNDYTDSLTKDNELNALQYHYAPAYNDEMPDDDADFILDAMHVEFSATRIDARTDGNAGEWEQAARHWRCTFTREHWGAYTCEFSQGSAHKHAPTREEVLQCLLSDAASYDSARDFADWCADLGFDTDSRRAERMWKACGETHAALKMLFSDDQREALAELLDD